MKRLLMAVLLVIFYVTPTFSETIFKDDFTSWPNGFTLDTWDYDPSYPDGLECVDDWVFPDWVNWSLINGNISSGATICIEQPCGQYGTCDCCETHYAGEILSPGLSGVTDQALYLWRGQNYWFSYGGSLSFYRHSVNAYKEIYFRWRMRIPADFELAEDSGCIMNYLKLWRWRWATRAGLSGPELYLNFNGSSFSTSNLQIGKSAAPGAGWHTLIDTSSIRDGNVHTYELRITLNTTTSGIPNADASITFWLDGGPSGDYSTPTAIFENLDYGVLEDEYFSSLGFGLGNTGASGCTEPYGNFQDEWRAIVLDDLEVSTTQVGLIN